MKITRKGRWTVRKAGTLVSEHNDSPEAFEAAANAGGLCTVTPPAYEVDTPVSAPVPAPPAPVPAPPAPVPAPPAPTPPAPAPATGLRALSSDPIDFVPKPALGESYIDPAYGVTVRRVTDAQVQYGTQYARHFYSRKQAFSHDNSKLLIWTTDGYWHLHDARTGAKLLSPIPGPAGDCECQWAGPDTIVFTAPNGGLVWYAFDLTTMQQRVLFDLRGKLPWTDAERAWTRKGEGSLSADCRQIALLIEGPNWVGLGVVHLNIETGVMHSMSIPADNKPDHVSVTPSGERVVVAFGDGVRSCTKDFASSILLHQVSEHSDIAIGPNGEDLFVYADYHGNAIRYKDCATGEGAALTAVYPRSGSSYALHISGRAFDRPGWVVVSTYADAGDYGEAVPDSILEPQYRKVFLAELKPGGQLLNLAHTRVIGSDYGGYFGEHQATASRDLSKVAFASNWGDGKVIDTYVIDVPSV